MTTPLPDGPEPAETRSETPETPEPPKAQEPPEGLPVPGPPGNPPLAPGRTARGLRRVDDTTHQYGSGRNCFTVAEDGRSDVLVYHARQYKEITGDPLHDPNRHTRIQRLGWKPDGTPDFGIPVADTVPEGA
jgi:hypothetical protein